MFCVSPGGSSQELTPTQELKTGCTQVDTLTGITQTVPTFIDTGGARLELFPLIGFTLFLIN